MEDHRFMGMGTVITFTTIYNATEDFDRMTPYNLAIIELDEGPRLTGQVTASPEEMKIGMRVRPIFRILGKEGESGIIYYGTKFEPQESSPRRGKTGQKGLVNPEKSCQGCEI